LINDTYRSAQFLNSLDLSTLEESLRIFRENIFSNERSPE
jgi:hypothetical protein